MLGLGPEKEKKIFASRYKLLLPSEAELNAELLRELKSIGPAAAFRFQLSEFQLFGVAHEPRSPRQHLDRLRHLSPLGCRRANTSHATCLVRATRIPISGLPHGLARIRDKRSSERVFSRKVFDIYANSINYDPNV
jgi:hypothetical protein